MNIKKRYPIALACFSSLMTHTASADFGSMHQHESKNRGMKVGPVNGKVQQDVLSSLSSDSFEIAFDREDNSSSDSRNSTRDSSRNNRGRGNGNNGSETANLIDVFSLLNAHLTGVVESTIGAHVDQAELESLERHDAYLEAFELGDEIFEMKYNVIDGIGVNVGDGRRFSRLPRLDLDASDAWASIMPHRITGPNGDSCIGCHNLPFADGAGEINDNTVRIDPAREQEGTIQRQTPHMFGMGAQQLLAEEMTTELQAQRDAAVDQACEDNSSVDTNLSAKGIDFGEIVVRCRRIDYSDLDGVDPSLVVKPYEWKGLTASVRDFVRGAMHQELGMQAEELVGDADMDFDGVSTELTVGDITSLAVYAAGQPRPVTKLELNSIASELSDSILEMYGLPLSDSQVASINNGEQVFEDVSCADCHTPALTLDSPVFSEPSTHPDYFEDVFPAGGDVRMPQTIISFDLSTELEDNAFELASGQTLGNFERTADGETIVRLYGDLKRHDMGESLAEAIDEGRVGNSTFITETLWGVGSTPPYLHDGRATTLIEAIAYHGGDALDSRDAFMEASTADQADLLAFLNNLVIFLDEEE